MGFCRGNRPAAHIGRGISVPTRPRNSSASGQFAANANRIRLAVSLMRTAILSRRSRMAENSPLASGINPPGDSDGHAASRCGNSIHACEVAGASGL